MKLLQALNCFLDTPIIHQIKQSRHVRFSFLYDTETAFLAYKSQYFVIYMPHSSGHPITSICLFV